jgi:hypothetical protein
MSFALDNLDNICLGWAGAVDKPVCHGDATGIAACQVAFEFSGLYLPVIAVGFLAISRWMSPMVSITEKLCCFFQVFKSRSALGV